MLKKKKFEQNQFSSDIITIREIKCFLQVAYGLSSPPQPPAGMGARGTGEVEVEPCSCHPA